MSEHLGIPVYVTKIEGDLAPEDISSRVPFLSKSKNAGKVCFSQEVRVRAQDGSGFERSSRLEIDSEYVYEVDQ